MTQKHKHYCYLCFHLWWFSFYYISSSHIKKSHICKVSEWLNRNFRVIIFPSFSYLPAATHILSQVILLFDSRMVGTVLVSQLYVSNSWFFYLWCINPKLLLQIHSRLTICNHCWLANCLICMCWHPVWINALHDFREKNHESGWSVLYTSFTRFVILMIKYQSRNVSPYFHGLFRSAFTFYWSSTFF